LKSLERAKLSAQKNVYIEDRQVKSLSCEAEFIADFLHPIDQHHPHMILNLPPLCCLHVIDINKVALPIS